MFRIPEIYVALKEVAKVQVEIADRERIIFSDSLEKSRDVMIAILPSLISSKIKRECNGCFTSHPSQTQHSCLEEVSEEDRTDRIKHAISQCTSGMINMVFACNGRPISSVDAEAVKAMYGTEIDAIRDEFPGLTARLPDYFCPPIDTILEPINMKFL